MDYFDNGPLLKSLYEVESYNTAKPTKTISTGCIVLIGLFIVGGYIYYWYKYKKKEE